MIDKIIDFSKQFNPPPISVFLYGSQATGETNSDSDYEIGFIFNDDDYISRREIKTKQDFDGVSIYPFRLSELKNYTLDTPFPKKFFVYQLIKSGKTISGNDILAQIKIPQITKLDLVGAIRFEIGVAFCSFLTMRRNDSLLANNQFSKSCLNGLRLLIFLKHGELLTTYKDIYSFRKKLNLPDEYQEVVEAAYNFRQRQDVIKDDLIYKNMSFLNFIENEIMKSK